MAKFPAGLLPSTRNLWDYLILSRISLELSYLHLFTSPLSWTLVGSYGTGIMEHVQEHPGNFSDTSRNVSGKVGLVFSRTISSMLSRTCSSNLPETLPQKNRFVMFWLYFGEAFGRYFWVFVGRFWGHVWEVFRSIWRGF